MIIGRQRRWSDTFKPKPLTPEQSKRHDREMSAYAKELGRKARLHREAIERGEIDPVAGMSSEFRASAERAKANPATGTRVSRRQHITDEEAFDEGL